MPFIEWNDKLTVNINDIDKQHQLLVKYINELHDGLEKKLDRDYLGKMINRLVIYSVMHFAKEEDYFYRFDYPLTDEHIKLHHNFEDKVTEFEELHKAGKAELTEDILDFLKEWVVNHILGSDKKYSKFLVSKGLK